MISVFVGFVCWLPSAPPEPDRRVPTQAQLQAKYAFESIYLTTVPLHDIDDLLRNESKYSELLKWDAWKVSLPALRQFIENTRQPNLNRSVAFILLDLRAPRAGYKKLDDPTASVTTLPWNPVDVVALAQFSDLFLNGQLELGRTEAALRAGQTTVRAGFDALEKLRTDPFVPSEALAAPLAEFALLLKAKPEQMKELVTQDKALHDRIRKFEIGFDELRQVQLSNEEWTNVVGSLKLLNRRETLRDTQVVDLYFKSLGQKAPDRNWTKEDMPPDIKRLIKPPKLYEIPKAPSK